jgi:hypothetical protein
MKRQTVAVVGLGLVLATPPLRSQERSYSATKEVVWNAVHEAFSVLQIAVASSSGRSPVGLRFRDPRADGGGAG